MARIQHRLCRREKLHIFRSETKAKEHQMPAVGHCSVYAAQSFSFFHPLSVRLYARNQAPGVEPIVYIWAEIRMASVMHQLLIRERTEGAIRVQDVHLADYLPSF